MTISGHTPSHQPVQQTNSNEKTATQMLEESNQRAHAAAGGTGHHANPHRLLDVRG